MRRLLVKLLVSQNQYKEAISLQEEEVAEFPEDQEALHYLALLHYWQRDYRVSSDIYQRLLEKSAGDAGLRLEAAKAAEAGQDSDRALNQYLWLYARNQGQKEYALALARIWAQKGNHAEAAGVLGPLMEEQPDLALRRWYALELLLIGDFDKAQTNTTRPGRPGIPIRKPSSTWPASTPGKSTSPRRRACGMRPPGGSSSKASCAGKRP